MTRHRKLRGRKLKSQKRIVLASIIGLTMLFSVGYAAFSTNITLNAKGNVKGYTVMFDANDGSVSKTSKRVKYGATYGDLPTPTREGYTFKGWHGKNLLNITNKESEKNGLHYIVTDQTIHIYGENTKKDIAYGLFGYDTLNEELEQNKTYTFSSFGINNSNVYSQTNYWIKDLNSQASLGHVNYVNSSIVFTIPENYDRFAQVFIGIKNTADIVDETFKIQLEEGNEPDTKWEPYYITSETEVVQEKDHTLTAIWEENPQTQETTN